MIKTTAFLLLILSLAACTHGTKGPDVSNIQVALTTQRFEQDFFALDTNALEAGMQTLQAKYPGFTRDFIINILGIPAEATAADREQALHQFLRDYKPVKQEAEKSITDFSAIENDVRTGLQHVKYYFPQYKLPGHLISFVGPMDAFAQGATAGGGDIIMADGLGVGLQLHLGHQSALYTSEAAQQMYPSYISRRFEPNTIAVNCLRNVVDDLVPETKDPSLLGIMIDKGKRLYLLDLFMPASPDTLKIGYTAAQLKGALDNEGLIWNFFLENNLVYETDAQKIKSYVGEGPKTDELGDGSPGYIALFTGRQIVRAYMEKFPKTTPQELLALDPRKILTESAYKPR